MIIRRYINFEKFVYLLNDGLFCPKSRLFEDQWEGVIAQYEKQNDAKYINNFSKAREWIYLSCWHMETAESYAMWKIYGEHQYSVCIETTKAKIEELFQKSNLAASIYSCEVVYGSPDEHVVGPAYSVLKESNSILEKVQWWYGFNHGIKHKAYIFEKEYRVIIVDERFNLEILNELQGLTLKIAPAEIIDSVIVSPRAPEWFVKIVSDILRKYDLSLNITKSNLELRHGS